MSDIPVWLLDIDGVINACTRKPDTSVWPADVWEAKKVNGFPILCARPALDFITAVHKEGRAEVRWHTTWQKDSALIEQAYGLPSLPVQDCPEFAGRYGNDAWFKLPAAERVVMKEGRDLIWTDDDLVLCNHGDEWVTLEYMKDERRVLTIAPHDTTGLTPKHLRQIAEFLGTQYPAVAS